MTHLWLEPYLIRPYTSPFPHAPVRVFTVVHIIIRSVRNVIFHFTRLGVLYKVQRGFKIKLKRREQSEMGVNKLTKTNHKTLKNGMRF